jgi:hypothetical protein
LSEKAFYGSDEFEATFNVHHAGRAVKVAPYSQGQSDLLAAYVY